MGKPSSTRLSTSRTSIQTMNSRKKKALRKKNHELTNKKIKTLFNVMRNESLHSIQSNSNNNTVILIEDSTSPMALKRKNSQEFNRSVKKVRTDICIKIQDDLVTNLDPCPETSVQTPVKSKSNFHCSTPKDVCNNENLNVSNIPDKTESSYKSLDNSNATAQEYNRDSYFTIDLTTETNNNSTRKSENTVIDLVNASNNNDDDCIITNSDDSLSMSGDSEVTVLNKPMRKRAKDKHLRRFASGISRLNASDKGKLLELITQKIFSGCNVPDSVKKTLDPAMKQSRTTETVEDTYIREVILGETRSRNSIGSNIYNPEKDVQNKTGLRMVIIDGSNVAMEHGKGRVFSVKGLKICIEYFINKGHKVKAFVPRFRCKFGKSTEPRLLDELERRGLVVYTPSREVQGRFITPYDDRYIIQCAAEFDGVIVSGDNYRDLINENPRWRRVIETRLLPFTWVDDMIMFPRDPLGRNGPTLEKFLSH